MRNHLTIVKAILCKTVARGATVGEEAAAVAKAVEMMGKYHIPHSAVASIWPKGWDFHGRRAQPPQRPQAQPKTTHHTNAVAFARAVAAGTKTLGDMARELLKVHVPGHGQLSYGRILGAIMEKFPNARTSINSLRWYESQLRKEGWAIPAKRPLKG